MGVYLAMLIVFSMLRTAGGFPYDPQYVETQETARPISAAHARSHPRPRLAGEPGESGAGSAAREDHEWLYVREHEAAKAK